MKLYQNIKGTFKPRHLETLRDECLPFIDKELEFSVGWVIEPDQVYKGQFALIPKGIDMGWIPEEDVVDITIL